MLAEVKFPELNARIEKLAEGIHNQKLRNMFKNCFYSTLETTTKLHDDGCTYVFTGDIPAMWLRDSSAQVMHYLRVCDCPGIKEAIAGLVKLQMRYIALDPYANAFNEEANGAGHGGDATNFNENKDWIWERKYEIDSLCYPVWISYKYWKKTGDTSIFDEQYQKSTGMILELFRVEQHHEEKSPYRFQRFNCPETDTLPREGKGAEVAYTGMTWSGFRPSDDACVYGYLVPSNMFAVVILGYLEEIYTEVYHNADLAASAGSLKDEIEAGIQKYAVFDDPDCGKVYAYEVDGKGNAVFMDDANVPSLLSLPYLGYCDMDDPIYQNTRKYILSKKNPYYYEGSFAKGIGSPHTPPGYIWHIALVMEAMTCHDDAEKAKVLNTIMACDGGTEVMHEGFDANDPTVYTREWFAWANSLLAYFILEEIDKVNTFVK